MKIDENLLNKEYKRVYTDFDGHPFYLDGNSKDVFFLSIFTRSGETETFICSVIKGSQ
jgi:hypothetical protein